MKLTRAVGAALKAFGTVLSAEPSARQSLSSQMAAEHAWFLRGDDPPWMQKDKITRPYAESGTVHRCVKVLADIVSGIPYELFAGEKSENPLKSDNAIVRTLARPNERMSGRQLVSRTVMDLLLYGNALWLLDGMATVDKRNRVAKFPGFIYPLPTRCLTAKTDAFSGKHIGWTVTLNNGRTRDYSLDETLHFFLENPDNDVIGMSEVGPASLEVESLHVAALTNLRILRKGGPGTLIERADPNSAAALFGAEGDDKILREFNESFAGENDKNAFLLPPGVKAHPHGASQRDMDFERLMRLARESGAGVMGVPPSLLGILEYANYANMGSQLEYVFHFTAFPMSDRIEATLQHGLLDRFATGLNGYFDKESVKALYQNLNTLAQSAEKFTGMAVPFEEVNRRLDLGFDTTKYPWLTRGYLPLGVTPADRVDEGLDVAADIADATGDAAPPPKKAERLTQAAEMKRTAKWLAYMRVTDGLEQRMLGSWRSFLTWMHTATLANLGQAARVTQSLTRQDDPQDPVPPDGVVDEHAVSSTEESGRRNIVAGRRSLTAEVSAELKDWKLADPRVTKLLEQRAVPIKIAGRRAAQRVRAVVAEGVTQGESIEQIAERVRLKFREEYSGQAVVVARTETLAGFSLAREQAKFDAGITSHEWLSARDDRVRESHQIDGEVVAVGAEFSNGLKHPHDPDAGPEDTINCRCVAVAVENAA